LVEGVVEQLQFLLSVIAREVAEDDGARFRCRWTDVWVWGGWFALFLGPLGARVLFEIAIVVFRIYQSIEEVRKAVTAKSHADTTLSG